MAGIRPGDVIAGKFRVERILGEGGMGYVVSARHLQLGQMVALKFMRDEICTPDYKSRFLREARNTVRLKSKHVSRVLDVGALEGGAPYMVMEYLEGTDLSDLLHKKGPVPAHEACEYVLQACEAISEAHGYGIVHRDLKPANLFLTKGQSGEPIVKVLDFGVSKVLDLGMEDDTNPGGRPRRDRPDSVVTKVTDLLGSPSYMAPEQIISARDADARSDIWSLGVILFRLISGKAPFHAPSLGELIQQIMHGPLPNLRDAKPDVPHGLENVVARCLERDRNARLSDVIELARLLAPYAGPVATPSLERIAILGPALVASAPPPPQPSAPSFHSASSANSMRNAWTAPPMRVPPLTDPGKKDISPVTAAIWAGVFVVIVGVTAVMVASIAGKNRDAAVPPSAEPAGGFDTASPPLTPPNLDPASTGGPVVTTAVTTTAMTTTTAPNTASPKASVHAGGGHARPRPNPTPRSDTKPASATTAAGIPETRE
ncbi:MAG: serine/threonine protein kinase [Myxococcaceae bacterium]|nr:serine/threonine protein kinase [Myxococcaceae bacterium]